MVLTACPRPLHDDGASTRPSSRSTPGLRAAASVERAAPKEIDPALPGLQGDNVFTSSLRAAIEKNATAAPRSKHKNDDGSPQFVNRLIKESSPYLLQHAHNPVNWFPWSDEAFARVRRQNKPVLLSVGYSTCHWCHVMEHESFEDIEIATFLNEHFVCIKVDREARPDVDDVYMRAVQMMTGRGGWPMTVALTDDRAPFFGGTYFPARDGDRGARMGFLTILRDLAAKYETERDNVVAHAASLSARMAASARPAPPGAVPDIKKIDDAVAQFHETFDATHGGFGRAPKFPRPAALDFLLTAHHVTNDVRALEMVSSTLRHMSNGGIYDHVGGGFHRYSTDATWLTPHFEKMLYDNAQLTVTLLHTHQATRQTTGDDFFLDVARDVVRAMRRDMRDPRGGFYAATDADSETPSGESEEGWFFTFTPAEIRAVLDDKAAGAVSQVYDVTERGNFEGRNIFHRVVDDDSMQKATGMSSSAFDALWASSRPQLYAERAARPAPFLDDKIITGWNGLMISALARLGFIDDDAAALADAVAAANFVEREMVDDKGRLRHVFAGGAAREAAIVDDHAFYIQGLLDLFEATSDLAWLERARHWQEVLDAAFHDDENGGYFLTAHDAETLIFREKPSYDGAEPSGNAVAAKNLFRLAALTDDKMLRRRGERVLGAFARVLEHSGSGSPKLLEALAHAHSAPVEVFIVRPLGAKSGGGNGQSNVDDGALDLRTKALVDVLRRTFIPVRATFIVDDGAALTRAAQSIPALDGKRATGGQPTAYVCLGGVCARPVHDAQGLARELKRAAPVAR